MFETLERASVLLRPNKSGSFLMSYNFWRSYLLERCMMLFEWDGLRDVPRREIELPLLLNGLTGVYAYEGEVTPFFATYTGEPTVFYDTYRSLALHSPIFTGVFNIGETCIDIRNNTIARGIYPLIHRYAMTLGHMDITLICTLINAREAGGTAIAGNTTQLNSIREYRNALCNGTVGAILDPAFSGVQFISANRQTAINIKDLIESMGNELDAFYRAIGVKTAYDKKGNMIEAEVTADESMVLLNLADMEYERQKGADRVNKMFGTSWTVERSKVLRYTGGNANAEKS